MAKGKQWARDDLIKVLALYTQIPFGRMHKSATEVIELASVLDRSPSSIAMKLTNFASFDPTHANRGISGLKNASRLDKEVWDEFHLRWEVLAEFDTTAQKGQPPENHLKFDTNDTEYQVNVSVRRGHSFFRRTVLNSYEKSCCITGISCPALLRASHIIPWASREDTRLDPRNGLCLNALHDAAFDRGLMTIDMNNRVLYSESIWSHRHSNEGENILSQFEGVQIKQAFRHSPLEEYLAFHREQVFVG